MTPIQSACLVLPLQLIQTLSSLAAGLITTRTGGVLPQIRFGYALWAVGLGIQTTFNRTTSFVETSFILLIMGIGIGMTLQSSKCDKFSWSQAAADVRTALVGAQAGAPPKDRAVVTGVRNCLRTNGGAVGLAVCNAILNNVLSRNLPGDLPPDVRANITHRMSGILPDTLSQATKTAVFDVYRTALRDIYIFFIPAVVLSFVSSTTLTPKVDSIDASDFADAVTLRQREFIDGCTSKSGRKRENSFSKTGAMLEKHNLSAWRLAGCCLLARLREAA